MYTNYCFVSYDNMACMHGARLDAASPWYTTVHLSHLISLEEKVESTLVSSRLLVLFYPTHCTVSLVNLFGYVVKGIPPNLLMCLSSQPFLKELLFSIGCDLWGNPLLSIGSLRMNSNFLLFCSSPGTLKPLRTQLLPPKGPRSTSADGTIRSISSLFYLVISFIVYS